MTVYLASDQGFADAPDYGIECLPWAVAVEMVPRAESTSAGIVLTDDLQSEMRADLAIGIGGEIKGLEVYVRHDRGKCIQGFGWGGQAEARSEVRFYGINGGFDFAGSGEPSRVGRYPWWEAVLCDKSMRPLGKNVLVKLAPKPESVGGIYLQKRDIQRDPVAEVVAVGPLCEHLSPGDKVIFHEGAVDGPRTALLVGEGWDDHAIVSEDYVYAKQG